MRSQRAGNVYFFQTQNFAGPIKIGFSTLPEYRLNTIMKWSPYPLEIAAVTPGTFALETALHEHFADAHLHSEWFHPIERLLRGIEVLRQGGIVEDAFDLSVKNGSIRSGEERSAALRTPIFKQRRSYRSRLIWAERRLHAHLPKDVESIMHFSRSKRPLTEAEITRLEEVLREPDKHLVRWS
jgi:hypothetical protein